MVAQTALAAALSQIKKGRCVIPIPHGSKAPRIKDWQALRITEADADQYFNGEAQNIGLLLGEPSGWLIDVDLDCSEAVIAAREFFPPPPPTVEIVDRIRIFSLPVVAQRRSGSPLSGRYCLRFGLRVVSR